MVEEGKKGDRGTPCCKCAAQARSKTRSPISIMLVKCVEDRSSALFKGDDAKMRSAIVFLLCMATALVAADLTCMYGIDNSDGIFLSTNPYNGTITTLSNIPDNSSARVSATYNAADKQYIMVSQLMSSNDDGYSLLTVDLMSGKVLHNIALQSTHVPTNLAYDSAAKQLFALYYPEDAPSSAFVALIDPVSGAVRPVSHDILQGGACQTVFTDGALVDEKRSIYYVSVQCADTYSIIGVNTQSGAVTNTTVSKAPVAISSAISVCPSTGLVYVESTNQTDFSANLFSYDTHTGAANHVCPLGALAYAWAVDWSAANPVYYRGTQVPFTHPNRFEVYTLEDGAGPTYHSLDTFGLVFSLHLFHAASC